MSAIDSGIDHPGTDQPIHVRTRWLVAMTAVVVALTIAMPAPAGAATRLVKELVPGPGGPGLTG